MGILRITPDRNATRAFLLVALFALAFTALVAFRERGAASTNSDFVAFYCAGRTVDAHGDPFAVEPLRTCEQQLARDPNKPSWTVTPVPLPGYMLAAFALLARFPYAVARDFWLLISFLGGGIAIAATTRLLRLPWFVVAAVLLPEAIYENALAGESTPIVLGALALAALYATFSRFGPAAVAFAAGMFEPHVTLPSLVATFAGERKARVPVALAVAVLSGATLVVSGIGGTLLYVTTALPLQARAEVYARSQFSLTHELALSGVDPRIALFAGSLSYLVMLALGAFVAVRARRAGLGTAWLAFVPAAFCMLGGSFVHERQVAVALLAALLLVADGEVPAWASLAVLWLLAIPWSTPAVSMREVAFFAMIPVAACAVATYVRFRAESPLRGVVVAGSAAVVALAMFGALHRLPAPSETVSSFAAPSVSPSDDAALVWRAYIEDGPAWLRNDPRFELEKIPTFCGLAGLVVIAVRRPGAPPRSRASRGRRSRA